MTLQQWQGKLKKIGTGTLTAQVNAFGVHIYYIKTVADPEPILPIGWIDNRRGKAEI